MDGEYPNDQSRQNRDNQPQPGNVEAELPTKQMIRKLKNPELHERCRGKRKERRKTSHEVAPEGLAETDSQ